MPETEETVPTPESKSFRRPLLLGLILAFLGAGAGFYAVWGGLVPLGAYPGSAAKGVAAAETASGFTTSDLAFVPVAPVIVSVGQGALRSHLRFSAELEVQAAHKSDVEKLMPRIVDVTNTYLRALKLADLEDGQALLRLRAQLLRRIQVVTGEGRINDLLIMEFVLN